MPLSHRNHAGWRMVCYLSGMETMLFFGRRVRVFVKKLLDVCAHACNVFQHFRGQKRFMEVFWRVKICFRGQVHEESAEVLCLAGLKGLVHRVVDEWPMKS